MFEIVLNKTFKKCFNSKKIGPNKQTHYVILIFSAFSGAMLLQTLTYLLYESEHPRMSFDRMHINILYWLSKCFINGTFLFQVFCRRISPAEMISVNLIYYFYTVFHNLFTIFWLYYTLFGPLEQFIYNAIYFACKKILAAKYHLYRLEEFYEEKDFLRQKRLELLSSSL